MTFETRWTESSFKKLGKLDGRVQKKIIEKLEEAAEDPFAVAKKLSGVNLYSIRVGNYPYWRAGKARCFSSGLWMKASLN